MLRHVCQPCANYVPTTHATVPVLAVPVDRLPTHLVSTHLSDPQHSCQCHTCCPRPGSTLSSTNSRITCQSPVILVMATCPHISTNCTKLSQKWQTSIFCIILPGSQCKARQPSKASMATMVGLDGYCLHGTKTVFGPTFSFVYFQMMCCMRVFSQVLEKVRPEFACAGLVTPVNIVTQIL